jgi:putative CocE/NonD family hydrolase
MIFTSRLVGAAVLAASLGLSAIGFAPVTGLAAQGAMLDPPSLEEGYIPVAVGTPDAAELHFKVITPDPDRFGPGPYPTVIDYSGYLPAVNIYDGLDDRFLDAGYAVVGLNIRGTGCSSGSFDYFEPLQSSDGAEAIGWLATRDWSNGRFAMVGKSYPGITQAFVAAEQPDALKAIVPGNIFADLYRDVPFPGGMMNVTFAGAWSAQRVYEGNLYGPVHTLETGDDHCLTNQQQHVTNPASNPLLLLLQEQYDTPTYRERSPWEFADRIDVPMFLIESWQDEQVGSRGTHLLERFRTDEVPWKFLGTNGDHGEYYGSDVFPHILRFLAYHLKQEAPTGEQLEFDSFEDAYVRYLAEDQVIINYDNGANGGRVPGFTKTYGGWPVPQQEVARFALTPDGSLVVGDGAPRGSVDYTYTPVVGAQERGGHSVNEEPSAQWSDRAPEGTTAAFTTDALTEDMTLLGSASLDLWLASTAVDTDVEVTLSELRPDGQELFVQQGWLRASHRAEDPNHSTELRPFQTHLLGDVAPMLPGTPELLRVEIFPFGHVFREGSKLRISVAAPHTKPDLWGFVPTPLPAVNTIYTGGAYPSSLALPLVAGATIPTDYPACGSLRNQPCRPEA